ncbi:MAG TPA: glycosyltransferase [Actinomycetales bacterium]|jgi:type III pantothenate kinase
MMRIAMVSEHASPLALLDGQLGGQLGGQDAGGQNVHVAALSQALAARGHEVVVYTRRDDPALPACQPFAPGVEVVHLDAGPPLPLPKDDLVDHVPAMGAAIAADWALRGVPDVVHAHFWMSALATGIAVRSLPVGARRPRTAVTFHALGAVKARHQGVLDTSPPQRVAAEQAVMQEVDAVVATCSDEVAELLAQGADPHRLHVVPCGVDLLTFTPEGRRLVPWSPDVARLLVLGRLVERKGVDTAIAALADVRDAELVVAGGSADAGSDPDVTRLRAAAHEAGVTDRVRFVGRVDPQDAAALMRAADLVVTVPWYEPFGIVPLEAMACGTPVVASEVGGMLDTVQDGVTGVLVPPRDPAALATAVTDLLGRPGELVRRGRAAAEHVAATYGWDRVAADTEAVYRAMITDEVLVDLTAHDLPRSPHLSHDLTHDMTHDAIQPARHEEAR